jgi:hypothetical protein
MLRSRKTVRAIPAGCSPHPFGRGYLKFITLDAVDKPVVQFVLWEMLASEFFPLIHADGLYRRGPPKLPRMEANDRAGTGHEPRRE